MQKVRVFATISCPHVMGRNPQYSSTMRALPAAFRVLALLGVFPCMRCSSCHCSLSQSPPPIVVCVSYREVRIAAELTLKTLGTGTVSLVASPLAETTVTVGLDMVAVVY